MSEFETPPDTTIQVDKIKAAIAAKGGIPRVEKGTETPPAAAESAPEPAKGKKAEPKPAAAAPKEPEAPAEPTEESPTTEEAATEEPKTARAKEWAEIKGVKAALAKEIRSFKKAQEQFLKDQAEFSKVQTQLAELNKLRDENPGEFLKRVAPKGDMRALFKAALEQPEETPEQRENRELKETVAALKERLDKGDETAKQREEREKRESEERAQVETRRKHAGIIYGALQQSETLDKLKQLPQKLQNVVVFDALERAYKQHDDTGAEPNILEILSAIEDELFPEQPAPPQAAPPVRAAGAEPTAKPEAKRAPVLRTATATARATAATPQTFEERLRSLAPKLKRV